MIEINPTQNKKYIVIFVLIFMIGFVFFNLIYSNKSQSKTIKKIQVASEININLTPPLKTIDEPDIKAKSVILIDQKNKYPLYAKADKEKVPIASTTKMITALVAYDLFQMDEIVNVDPQVAKITGSRIGLYSDEKISVDSLIQGLLIKSGNDAAYALAYHYSGGLEGFIQKMNEKGEEIGLKNFHFTCPAGLDDQAYSNAFNLAIIGAQLLENKHLTEIVRIANTIVYNQEHTIVHTLKNSNRLINIDEPTFLNEAIGIKTGFTEGAGHCLVSAIKYKDHTLIGVVLNTYAYTVDASAIESKKLMLWGMKQIDLNQNNI